MQKTAIVVGAGIVGLATARALAVRNYKVTVIERTQGAMGASVRNFGMFWPIAQPDGELFEMAMHARSIWKTVGEEAGVWHDETGSLHVAKTDAEWKVLQELADVYQHRGYRLLNKEATLAMSPYVVADNLYGSLYSPHEMIIESRKAIAQIPDWLSGKYGVDFIWGKAVNNVDYPSVHYGNKSLRADEIYVCSGADFETLYPEQFENAPLTKCKLQMMRMASQPDNARIGPPVCGGLSLIHYNSFKVAPSLSRLNEIYQAEYADYIKWGIHVMVSQNHLGELTVGDSHEYGHTHNPFDKAFVNQLILDYLARFVKFPNENVVETWHGVYAKLTNGEPYLLVQPEEGVYIINGLGGAGMTLSFGLCDRLVAQ